MNEFPDPHFNERGFPPKKDTFTRRQTGAIVAGGGLITASLALKGTTAILEDTVQILNSSIDEINVIRDRIRITNEINRTGIQTEEQKKELETLVKKSELYAIQNRDNSSRIDRNFTLSAVLTGINFAGILAFFHGGMMVISNRPIPTLRD